MLRLSNLILPLHHSDKALKEALLHALSIPSDQLTNFSIRRRAHDARNKKQLKFVYTIDFALSSHTDEENLLNRNPPIKNLCRPKEAQWFDPSNLNKKAPLRPVVVGSGPCGLFCALHLARAGLRPIILERGKAVKERTKDSFGFWRGGPFNPESNVQFGEGGAGTFSDGKLYSGVSDPRELGQQVLHEFVKAGAPEEITYLSKPHIGTFRLVTVVQSLRAEIESLGGEYRFESLMTKVVFSGEGNHRQVSGVQLQTGEVISTNHLVLALGHSARDSFKMLHSLGVSMEAKAFSIGVRIEHPQTLINSARFGESQTNPLLGAADYKLVSHTSTGRTAYSFCMCPGGQVVAATSEVGQVVTNGMSQYSRAERNANSALVVDVHPGKDFGKDVLDGVEYQRHWEKAAFVTGGSNYRAPAQLLGDFLENRPSKNMKNVIPSYQPGVKPADLRECLPKIITDTLSESFKEFNKKIPGYLHEDAVMTGVETRTSSPIRILRDETGQSPGIKGLFPAGEGAGYAGGILSASIDGIKTAENLISSL